MKRTWYVGAIIVLAIWFLIDALGISNPLAIAPPLQVFKKLFELLSTGELIRDIIATMSRTFIGFLLALILGIPAGIVLGYYTRLYESFSLVIDFFRSVPGTALFPLFLVLFGLGDEAKIANVVFASGLIIVVNTIYGVRNGNKTRQIVAKIFKANNYATFTKVILPEAIPSIVGGLRIALSISLIVIVVTEMFVGTENGLGRKIYQSHQLFKIADMYATIIVTGLLGYSLNIIIQQFESRFIHWSGQ